MIETGPLGTKWSTSTDKLIPTTSRLPLKIETSLSPWTAFAEACFRWGTIRSAKIMAPTASTASWKATSSAPFNWPRKNSPWTTMKRSHSMLIHLYQSNPSLRRARPAVSAFVTRNSTMSAKITASVTRKIGLSESFLKTMTLRKPSSRSSIRQVMVRRLMVLMEDSSRSLIWDWPFHLQLSLPFYSD